MSQAQKSRLMRWSLGLVMSLTLVSIALLLVDPGKPAVADTGGDCGAGGGGGGAADCITVGGPCDVDTDCDEGFVCDQGTCIPEEDCKPALDANGDPIPNTCVTDGDWENDPTSQDICLGEIGPPFGPSAPQAAPGMAAVSVGWVYQIIEETVGGNVTINPSTGAINATNVTGPGYIRVRITESDGTLVGDYVVFCGCCGVFDVAKIVLDGTTDEGPASTCTNETISLRALAGSECGFPESGDLTWSYQSSPDGLPSPFVGYSGSSNSVANVRPTATGTYIITAGSENFADGFVVNAFGLSSIIVKNSDPPDGGPADVVVGESITLTGIGTDEGSGASHSWDWQIQRPVGSQVPLTSQGADLVVAPDVEGTYTALAGCNGSAGAMGDSFAINAIRVPSITSINAWDFTGGFQGQLYTDGVYIPAEQNLSLKLQAVGDATFPEQTVINWTATNGAGSFQGGVSAGETVYFDRTIGFLGAITITATVANASDGTSQKTFVVNSYTSEMTVADNANLDNAVTTGGTLNLFADGNGDAQIKISITGDPGLPPSGAQVLTWRVKDGSTTVDSGNFSAGPAVADLNTTADVTTFTVESLSGSTIVNTVTVKLYLNSFTLVVTDHDSPTDSVSVDGTTNTYAVLDTGPSSIDLSVTGVDASVAGGIVWRIVGASASPSSGNFATPDTSTLTPVGSLLRFTVQAGYDGNTNGTLDDAEASHQVAVVFPRDITLTVMENLSLSNQVQVPSMGSGDLTINLGECETGEDIKLSINGTGSTPGGTVFWQVAGETTSTPSNGNFGSADPVITLTPTESGSPPVTNNTYTVLVGYDLDDDGQWDTEGADSEVTHTATVTVNPTAYELKVADHDYPERNATTVSQPPHCNWCYTASLDLPANQQGEAEIDVVVGGRPTVSDEMLSQGIDLRWQIRAATSQEALYKGTLGANCQVGPYTLTPTADPENHTFLVEVGLGTVESNPSRIEFVPEAKKHTVTVNVTPGILEITPALPKVMCKGQGTSIQFTVTHSASVDPDDIKWECSGGGTFAGADPQTPREKWGATVTWNQDNLFSSTQVDDVMVRARYEPTPSSNNNWIEMKATIIEVDNFSVSGAVEIPDPSPSGSDPPDTKAYGVLMAASGDVNVTAATVPAVAEANLPACWILAGGSGTGKLERTVPLTSSGATTITATAGTTTKRVKIYVFGIQVTSKRVPDLPSEFSPEGVSVAAGGLASGIHQAHVKIDVTPSFGTGNKIKVSLSGAGAGHEFDSWAWTKPAIPANLTVDGQVYDFGDQSPLELIEVSSKVCKVTSSNKVETTNVDFELVDLNTTLSTTVEFAAGDFVVDIGEQPTPFNTWQTVKISRSLDGQAIPGHKLRAVIYRVKLYGSSTWLTASADSASSYQSLHEYVEIGSAGGLWEDLDTDTSLPSATTQIRIVDPDVTDYEVGIADISIENAS